MNIKLVNRWTIGATVILVVLSLLLSASAPQPVQAVGKPELKRALLGTVRVAVAIDAQKDTYSTGSGTVLTADGYILTNFHVMGDTAKGKLYNSKGIAFIAVNPPDLKSLPTWLYQAQLVKGDPKVDLAVLKITAGFKGGALPKNLGLTPVPIGDSDQVEIGDSVHIVGYPGIGGDSVTYTSGTIAGFLDENSDKLIDWLKTDAEVNHGNSGGLAINESGEMIGIPTAGVADAESAGKISLIRPVSRALPLIKAAVVQSGSAVDVPPTGSGTRTTSTSARITKLVFSDSVDASNHANGKVGTTFPAGTQDIYAVFDYEGFANGQKFEGVWTRDGKSDVVSTLDWDAGASGSYWVSITNQKGIVEGVYDLAVALDGTQLYRARMQVGGVGKPSPTPAASGRFSAPTFAEGVTASNDPVKPHKSGEAFASGLTNLYAFANFQRMEDGLPWTHVWYVDGQEVLRKDNNWRWGTSGSFWVSIYNKKGLPNGQYKLELYISDQLVSRSETSVGVKGSAPLAADEGVQVTGTIVDADTKRPIKGATFLVLNPGVDAQSFLENGQDADIFAGGETDSKGQFTVDTPLVRGETYSLVASARGYQPVYQDEYTVADDEESPVEFEIELQKR